MNLSWSTGENYDWTQRVPPHTGAQAIREPGIRCDSGEWDTDWVPLKSGRGIAACTLDGGCLKHGLTLICRTEPTLRS
jgi:hypothetical protein